MATPATIAMIRRLVGFDTTSRESNLALVDFVRAFLEDLGVESELVHDESGQKANLYATFGPKDRGGICISGHTDVVPVDGQEWATEPFALAEKDGKLYGRGTADMKSWIAVALVFAPEFARRRLETPIHLAFSYDEEIGCLGVRGLIARLSERPHKPALCIVGEPTEMKVARAHKGKHSYRCRVSGLEAHSALTHKGVNAVEAAAELVARLKAMARQRRDHGPHDDAYDPPYTTVHTGVIRGGTALNIVPKACSFDFEFRHIPSDPPEALFEEVRAYAERELLPEMRRVSGAAGFAFDPLSVIPALDAAEDAPVTQFVKALTGANSTTTVAFGTEGGLFERAGMPTVVCGPGSIAQAHKPNEFITLEQVALAESFMRRLVDHASRHGPESSRA